MHYTHATSLRLPTWLAAFAMMGACMLQASAQQRRAPLPDSVEMREVTIWSDGTRMVGDLYLPKERAEGATLPAVIYCNGTGGVKQGAARFCTAAATNGFAALAFDYRGWGQSESQLMAVDPQPKPDETGEITIKVRALRWQMNYTDQTEDIRAAISFVAGEPSVDPARIGIFGTSYGGGLVTWVAGNDPRVKCLAAQVPGMGGPKNDRYLKYVYGLHTQQARGETEPVPIETGKMGGKMAAYSQMRVNPAKNIGYDVLDAAETITAPSLFVVAENEELSNNTIVQKLYQRLLDRKVASKYHVIPGITHYGVYQEAFADATQLELEWFRKYLMPEGDDHSF